MVMYRGIINEDWWGAKFGGWWSWSSYDTCNGCNMGMRDLPYMYAQDLRATCPKPQGWGPTYKTNHECTCYKCYVTLSLP